MFDKIHCFEIDSLIWMLKPCRIILSIWQPGIPFGYGSEFINVTQITPWPSEMFLGQNQWEISNDREQESTGDDRIAVRGVRRAQG